MSGHHRQRAPRVPAGHSVVFSDADRVEFNYEFAIAFPAMDVHWLMIPRVNLQLEAVRTKDGRHSGSISEPLGFFQNS
jgi:hypothetical protein